MSLLFRVVVLPPFLILLGAISLMNFTNLFKAVTIYASRYPNNMLLKTIQPGLKYVKLAMEEAFGKAANFKFNLTHVILMAMILAILGVYNSMEKANELKLREIALLKQKMKKKTE